MTAAASDLLESVLALPKKDRLKIAEALLDSLPNANDRTDEALYAELKRRAEEARTNPGAGIPWSEVRKKR